MGKYKVIVLCGSTRFKEDFIKMQQVLTLQGNLVLAPNVYSQYDDIYIDDNIINMLKEIHQQKIDMCDEIYVINKDGYIGKSTREEIKYAEEHNKVVKYMETK